MAALAPAYAPRRPTETVLYGAVRAHLETFLAWARESYEKPIPRYVENELRGYLRCGVFAHGFVRCRCDACGHDLLVAFSCKGRGLCPSCAGRRMANAAAHLVDRVLPDVPLRQFVLSLPFELRALAALEADVLGALGRMFVAAIFARYRKRARGVECGAVTFVQRFGGSLNLNVHFHVVVLDGVFTRDAVQRVAFRAASPPTIAELETIVLRVRDRALGWLRRRGFVDERPAEERSNEAPEHAAIEACAAIAMQRGTHATLSSAGNDAEGDENSARQKAALAFERDGFNLHAGVRIEAGDDVGRERLCRYGARPALSLERLLRLPGGRFAYRVKYARRGRAKHRVMTSMELLARLSALIPPPRHPLVRYSGVLAPRSAWRKDVVPKPRTVDASTPCASRAETNGGGRADSRAPAPGVPRNDPRASGNDRRSAGGGATPCAALDGRESPSLAVRASAPGARAEWLAPNVLGVRHWERLLGGTLYAATSRIDWATLLRRTFSIDVLECPTCHARLRVLDSVTERDEVRAVLERLAMPTEAPRAARARDPTDDERLAEAADE